MTVNAAPLREDRRDYDVKFGLAVRRRGIQQIDEQNEAYVWRWFIVPLCERRTRRTFHDVVTYSIGAGETGRV